MSVFVTNPLLKLATYTLYNRTTKITSDMYSLRVDSVSIHRQDENIT